MAELLIVGDVAAIEKVAGKLEANRVKNVESVKKLESLVSGEEDKKLFDEVKAKRQAFIEKRNGIIGLLKKASHDEARTQYDTVLVPAVAQYKGALVVFAGYQQKRTEAAGTELLAANAQARILMLASVALALALALLAAWGITRSIVRPIRESIAVANAMAAGDLTVRIESTAKDETGQLLSAMKNLVAKLSEVVSDVKANAASRCRAPPRK